MHVDCSVKVVDAATGVGRRVRVTGEADEPVTGLASKLCQAAPVAGPLFMNGAPLPTVGTLGSLGLVEGVTISVGAPWRDTPLGVPGTLALQIVGGYGAGRSFPLATGRYVLGRGSQADVSVPDPSVSRAHAQIDVAAPGEAILTDLSSRNGTLLEGKPVTQPTVVGTGEVIQIGATLFVLAQPAVETLRAVPEGGFIGVNRRFRAASASWPEKVAFPKPSDDGEAPSLNLLLTLAPGLAMMAIALFTGRLEFLLFAVVSPLIGVGRAVSQRRSWNKRKADTEARSGQDMAKARSELTSALRQEREGRRSSAPDLAELALQASLPGRRLWERQPSDQDFLEVRVGMASQPSTVAVTGSDSSAPVVWRVPLSVDLSSMRNLSLVGPRKRMRRTASSLVMQLAVREAPSSVKLCVVADAKAERDWGWMAWLPHCRWADDEPFVLVGSDDASTRARRGATRRSSSSAPHGEQRNMERRSCLRSSWCWTTPPNSFEVGSRRSSVMVRTSGCTRYASTMPRCPNTVSRAWRWRTSRSTSSGSTGRDSTRSTTCWSTCRTWRSASRSPGARSVEGAWGQGGGS